MHKAQVFTILNKNSRKIIIFHLFIATYFGFNFPQRKIHQSKLTENTIIILILQMNLIEKFEWSVNFHSKTIH